MREIVLDTETTGFSPIDGDRVVEIGCLELNNHVPTGKHFHCYLNPQRPMPMAAFEVHKLSDEFLKDKPLFEDKVDDFLDFIADSPLIIHNAPFDMGFLNHELNRVGKQKLPDHRAVDTLLMARQKLPGMKHSLDALCKYFHVDLEKRKDGHGALIDCELLAAVYLEFRGGRQRQLDLAINQKPSPYSLKHNDDGQESSKTQNKKYKDRNPHFIPITSQDEENHLNFMADLQPPKPEPEPEQPELEKPEMGEADKTGEDIENSKDNE